MYANDIRLSLMEDKYVLVGISSFIGILLGLILRSRKISDSKSRNPKYPRVFNGHVELISTNAPQPRKTQSLFDEAKYKLTLVIPAYNEEKRLERMLRDASGILKAKVGFENNYRCEVILVDDGSKDGTVNEYKRIVSSIGLIPGIDFKLIKTAENSGKGHAGVLASLGENILFADADGSTKFECLNRFDYICKKNGYDDLLICGSRCHLQNSSESSVKRSIFRLFLMKAFHLYLRIFGVKSVSDTQCGFKMLTRSAARKIVPWIHISGWIFDVEMLLLAEWKDIKICEVPVDWTEMNGTKLSLAVDSIKMAKDLLRIRVNYLLKLWKHDP